MISKIGGLVYGIDNPVSKDEPTIIISRILFSDLSGLKAAEWYELPNKLVHDVTEPNLESRSASSSARLSILRKGQRVIVYHHGSDAGGAYEVNWIIDLTAMKTTRIVVSHAGPEDEMKGIWLPLQKNTSAKYQIARNKGKQANRNGHDPYGVSRSFAPLDKL